MKVKDLIAILEECDADADVYVMSQQHYPFECALRGVAVREDFVDGEYEEGERSAGGDRWTASDTQLPPSDVFLVEGHQLRYGAKEAWDAART